MPCGELRGIQVTPNRWFHFGYLDSVLGYPKGLAWTVFVTATERVRVRWGPCWVIERSILIITVLL